MNTERATPSFAELEEYRLRVGGKEWRVLHNGALIGFWDEQIYLAISRDRLPFGLQLWSAAIALAHDLADRAAALAGTRVLELGAGTGLPGIVASSFGAHVTQTDHQEVSMARCRENGERNGVVGITHRVADWVHWDDPTRYDWIIGADIMYSESGQPHLRRIFEENLVPGGHVLVSDPFRPSSLRFLETLDGHGWNLSMTQWTIGEGEDARRVGVFDLTPQRASARSGCGP